MMHYFSFATYDQAYNNWVMFDPRPESPYAVLKDRFKVFCCPLCKRFSHDEVFNAGFDNNVRIRAKGDIFTSDEGFHCVSSKLHSLIQDKGFQGLECKPICDGKWFVANEVYRVNADASVYEIGKAVCANCGRPRDLTGLFDYLSQIAVPSEQGTFFTPVFDRRGSWNGNRDLFATEDVVQSLKQNAIKGGCFTRLLDQSEEKANRERIASGKLFKLPKGALVEL
jgi:hypothetical protein